MGEEKFEGFDRLECSSGGLKRSKWIDLSAQVAWVEPLSVQTITPFYVHSWYFSQKYTCFALFTMLSNSVPLFSRENCFKKHVFRPFWDRFWCDPCLDINNQQNESNIIIIKSTKQKKYEERWFEHSDGPEYLREGTWALKWGNLSTQVNLNTQASNLKELFPVIFRPKVSFWSGMTLRCGWMNKNSTDQWTLSMFHGFLS